jgi:transcriptional regulator with XRE-family HTH domain
VAGHTSHQESTDTASDEQRSLGIRLRTLRKSKQRSLKEIADDAQVSESFLSQVERGLTSPSIASLRRICSALGENMGALFAEEFESSDANERLVRVSDRRRIFRPDGSADYLLTPRIARHLEIHHNVIAPGRSSGPEPYA